jgi:hypothetical protein
MSPYLYRRLMREKLARVRRDAGARLSHTQSAHRASMLPLNPVRAIRPRLRAVEKSPVVTTPTTYRVLNQRTADGLVVTLEWNPATDALRIVVLDRETTAVTFPVTAADASNAFVHPFVYAGHAVREVA